VGQGDGNGEDCIMSFMVGTRPPKSGDDSMEDEMGRACRMHGGGKAVNTGFWWGNLRRDIT
jgi:hypothetical protein